MTSIERHPTSRVRRPAMLIALALLVAACGDDEPASSATSPQPTVAVDAEPETTLSTSTAPPTAAPADEPAEATFPVSVEHALGTTEIDAPSRSGS